MYLTCICFIKREYYNTTIPLKNLNALNPWLFENCSNIPKTINEKSFQTSVNICITVVKNESCVKLVARFLTNTC